MGELGAPETCEHCGGPLTRSFALVNFGGKRGCERMELPGYCPSPECRAARDEAAIADLVARGIIDP